MNKSFYKFVTDFGPLLVFFTFYYKNEKNLEIAIPPFILATLIALAFCLENRKKNSDGAFAWWNSDYAFWWINNIF